jgi:hypothetical protein
MALFLCDSDARDRVLISRIWARMSERNSPIRTTGNPDVFALWEC